MQLITDSNNFVLIRDYLKQGPNLRHWGFSAKFNQGPLWDVALGLMYV